MHCEFCRSEWSAHGTDCRGLDTRIAEMLFGWRLLRHSEAADGKWNVYWHPPGRSPHWPFDRKPEPGQSGDYRPPGWACYVPRYSTDWRAAGEVLECVGEFGFRVRIQSFIDGWDCWIEDCGSSIKWKGKAVSAGSAPLAIARAAAMLEVADAQ